MKSKFPNYLQPDSKDCGPTCIKIIAKHHGKNFDLQQLRDFSETHREGSNLLGLSTASEHIGFRTLGVKINAQKLEEVPLPCILHWNKEHFVVLYDIKSSEKKGLFAKSGKKDTYYISDPAHGVLTYTTEEFLKNWIGNNADETTEEGIALLLETTPKFHTGEFESTQETMGLSFISKYLFKYKKFIVQLIIGLIAGSLLQLLFPFLTQSIIDVGIKNQDIHFIYLILFAQLFLFIGRTAIEVIRSWILLHLSTRINISLVSDFFIKLMNLPISYFDTRMTGDILQRINDHSRIESLLTASSLNVLFSMVNLAVLGGVLAYYSIPIFGIFLLGSLLYFLWIYIFLKKRADIDYKRFSEVSQEQSKVIELINGMQEIKLHNAEKQKRWGWEYLQARLFKVSIEGLKLEQYQSEGSEFINELKNILITILAAKQVIDGDITLGMMLAITGIVGQLNAPVTQLINFVRELQDAKLSLERLAEIHDKEDEEQLDDKNIKDIPDHVDFHLKELSFRYIGTDSLVLKKLDLIIPSKKITAIVGTSGSGKTTLMKILLRFYENYEGDIAIGEHLLKNISQKAWRSRCGAVMQESYIFNDTIANNIAIGKNRIDKKRLKHAAHIANISEFVMTLPLSYNTKIGNEGLGLSTGQKQRLLIARAVYKDPQFLFFDEATSALDSNNETIIMERLNTFFVDRTVVVIAHRLSTVKNAHQIVVLDQGNITEVGSHKALIEKKGAYYHLVKNQLELGS